MATNSPLILVVDDEPHLYNALSRILKKPGYEVITTLNGESALQLVQEKRPDVILLDIMMPGIDGMEVCRRVRKLSPATKIIYFSAKAELIHTLKLRASRDGADAFIIKPASGKQILSKVSGVLKGTR